MKPEITLTQLEEEPETGFFGLTFTEVQAVFTKSFFVMIGIGGIAFIFLSMFFAVLVGMGSSVIFFYATVKSASSKRADKPLYYHKHLRTHKNKRLFIQPEKNYQRERTNYGRAKK